MCVIFFSVAAVAAAAVDALSYSLRIHSLNCLRVLNICVFVSFLSPLHDLHSNHANVKKHESRLRGVTFDSILIFFFYLFAVRDIIQLHYILFQQSSFVVLYFVCVFFFLQVFPSYFVRSIFSFWFVLIVCVCMWLF